MGRRDDFCPRSVKVYLVVEVDYIDWRCYCHVPISAIYHTHYIFPIHRLKVCLRASEVNFGPITLWLLHAAVFYVNNWYCYCMWTLTHTASHYIFLIFIFIFFLVLLCIYYLFIFSFPLFHLKLIYNQIFRDVDPFVRFVD